MRVGSVIREWRFITKQSLVDVSKDIGINHQSLRRLEEGKAPTAEVLIAVVKWMCSEEANANGSSSSGSDNTDVTADATTGSETVSEGGN